jgi:hypothetical protein
MALVNRGAGSGWYCRLIMADKQGDQTMLTYALRAVDEAAANTAKTAIINALGPVTRSTIIATSVQHWQDEDTNFLPATESDASVKAVISYKIDGAAKRDSFEIPDPDPAVVFVAAEGPSANIVDISAAEVIAYGDLFKDAAQAFISDGEDLEVLLKGKRTTRRRNR